MRQADLGPDYAMLVRGVDVAKGWINVGGARRLFDPVDLGLYNRILEDQASVLSADASQSVDLYGQIETGGLRE